MGKKRKKEKQKQKELEQHPQSNFAVGENNKKRKTQHSAPADGVYFSIFGRDAKPRVDLKLGNFLKQNHKSLTLKDIQDLLLWLLGDAIVPRWIFVSCKSLLSKVVVISVPGIDMASYTKYSACLPCLSKLGTMGGATSVASPWSHYTRDTFVHLGKYDFDHWNDQMMQTLFSKKLKKKKKVKVDATTATTNPSSISATLNIINQQTEEATTATTPTKKQQQESDEPAELLMNGEEVIERHTLVLSEQALIANEFPMEKADETYVQSESKLTSSITTSTTISATSSTTTSSTTEEIVVTQVTETTTTTNTDSSTTATSSSTTTKSKPRLIAMDCEMCITEVGFEITRVTLVDETYEVLYDEFVQPYHKILNYNTRYSGITEQHLEGVTKTLKDVQKDLLEIIDAETILIGHSLENDLRCLKFVHKRVIDTSVIYTHRKENLKHSLKYLAYHYLGRKIQQSLDGHDSIEDSIATLDLVKLKLQQGYLFGGSVQIESYESRTKYENIFKTILAKKSCVFVDRVERLAKYAVGSVSSVVSGNDDETYNKCLGECKAKNDFLWIQFHELEKFYEQEYNSSSTTRSKEKEEGKEKAEESKVEATTSSASQPAANSSNNTDANDSENKVSLDESFQQGGMASAMQTIQNLLAGNQSESPTASKVVDEKEERLKVVLAKLNQRLEGVMESLPENTLVIVLTGYGNITDFQRLYKQRQEIEKQESSPEKEAALQKNEEETAAQVTSQGRAFSFIGVK